jgi:hypothetical protein
MPASFYFEASVILSVPRLKHILPLRLNQGILAEVYRTFYHTYSNKYIACSIIANYIGRIVTVRSEGG